MHIRKSTYGGTKTILYNVDGMEALPVMVTDEGVDADERGKKIVRAGTLIGGGGVGTLLDKELMVTENNNADCEGVLLDDVDVTYGPMPGAMVFKGNINLNKIPEAPVSAAAAKLPMVRFLV
jgi:hypothetical protein